ncbi:HlyD family secretion protein [Magnetofaba australis]|nr:HlyD family efflux transporter periplasmic adaptor subunit [Magnetofaba australis]
MISRLLRGGIVVAALTLAGCGGDGPIGDAPLQGYVEGDYVRLAAPLAGELTTLSAQRGATIEAGATAFALERASETAQRDEAAGRLRAAQAQLADLQSGQRAEELKVIRAQLAQAEASRRLSSIELDRVAKLVRDKTLSQERLDSARAEDDVNRGHVAELLARLRVAELSARPDAIAAAEANVAAAQAALRQAQWRVDQKSVATAQGGLVEQTYYEPGEWVAAGQPVVSILPPENRKARFFIPEPLLGGVQVGAKVRLGCDGCGAPIAATIVYISPEAEYTPPVIYSQETRDKLVIMAEAKPDPADAVKLTVGQPLDVWLGETP